MPVGRTAVGDIQQVHLAPILVNNGTGFGLYLDGIQAARLFTVEADTPL
jgi:hypothetical protein